MAVFDPAKWRKAKLKAPEAVVSMPELAEFGGDEMRVRQLDSNELHHADTVVSKRKGIRELIEKLAGGDDKEKAQAVLEAMGYGDSDDMHDTLIKKIEHVRMALIEPVLTESDLVKLARFHPVPFQRLHNKVMDLTGQGGVAALEKPQPSGETRA